ncbi:MAG: adenylate kinase [Herpetosiphonaceae bacterium]|nr:MAG: adenylate kinase [Herpetosiphonaceae bacterium]
MNVILLGMPGAGKGTQAAILEKRTGMKHVASGDMFRTAVNNGTPLGLLAKQYLDNGELVPDDVVIGMVLERISQPDCANGVIFDGFPRTPEQARALEEALRGRGQRIDAVLLLTVPEEVLIQRVVGRRTCRNCQAAYNIYYFPPEQEGVCNRCGGDLYQRSDDTVETVKHRLEVYAAQTSPLIDYYRAQVLLHEIEGTGEIDSVTQKLLQALKMDNQVETTTEA